MQKTGCIAAMILGVVVFGGTVFGYSGGDGTEGNPYQVSTAQDLLNINNNPAACYVLINDINMSPAATGIPAFTQAPIAPDTSSSAGFQGTAFTGIFDGNNHVIFKLTITSSTKDYIGLFGYVWSGGQIQNIGVENVNLTGHYYVGGLIGTNDTGSISGCYATGSVSGNSVVGGLAGYNYNSDTFTFCYSDCSVSGAYAGGLVGYNYGSLTSCYSRGSVTGAISYAGGLVGYNYPNSTLISCYSAGKVTGGSYLGGLVGYNSNFTVMTDCFWNTQTNDITAGVGYGTSIGVTGETTGEMMKLATFTGAGWDFVGEAANGTADIWRMCVDGVEYPRLWWEFNKGDFVCGDGVDIRDFAVMAGVWQMRDGESGYNERCDIDMEGGGNGVIDVMDLGAPCEQWLEGK